MAGRGRWHGWESAGVPTRHDSSCPQGLTQERLLGATFPTLGTHFLVYLLLSGNLAHQLLAHQEQFARKLGYPLNSLH